MHATSKVLLQCSHVKNSDVTFVQICGFGSLLRAFSYRTRCEIILALSAEKMSTYKAVILETTCKMLSTK